MKPKKIVIIGLSFLSFILVTGPWFSCKWIRLAHRLQKMPISSTLIGPPKGHISAEEFAKKSGTYVSLFPAHHITNNTFALGDVQGNPIASRDGFVLQIPFGRIYGRNGVVITPDDLVLSDTAYEWVNSIEKHSIFRKLKLPKLEKTEETVAVFGSKGADCLYHWMFEILPRIEMLNRSGIAYDKLYLGKLRMGYQQSCLEKLGIDMNKVLWASSKTHIQAKNVIVPAIPGGQSGTMPKWACDFLRETFLPSVKKTDLPKRIYISRRCAPKRKILNEEELFSELQQLGFQEVLLEKLPFEEQVSLFASAELIVAPHGAGLSHLVFCSPGVKVVELFCPKHINKCYWLLAHHMNLDYHCELGHQENLTKQEQSDNDYYVSVGEVVSFLKDK